MQSEGNGGRKKAVLTKGVRRLAGQYRPHCAGGPVVSKRNVPNGGEPNEGNRRARGWFQRWERHRPREVIGKMETARS